VSWALSICIPSKNRQEDLRRCLDSICKQDAAPMETLVIDQSETPYELPSLKTLVHIYQPALSGVAAARNLGAKRCLGEVVLFLDDDVELEPGCLACLTDAFRDPSVVGASCNVTNEGREKGWWTLHTRIFSRGFFNSGRYKRDDGLVALRRLSGCAAAIRRSILLKEHFDENLIGYSYGEDWELSYRLQRYGTLVLVPDSRVIHHVSPRNRYSEDQMQRDRWDNFLYFYDKLGAARIPVNRFWKVWWMLGESLLWLKRGMGLPFLRRRDDVAAYSRSLRRTG
jgi:GT2 family glycosyltransferase